MRYVNIRAFLDELRPIAPAYLNRLLELMLNLLVSLSMKHTSVSVEALSTALADDHEVPRTVSAQVMSWFGELKDGLWKMDAEAVVREVGLGILRNHRVIYFFCYCDNVVTLSVGLARAY